MRGIDVEPCDVAHFQMVWIITGDDHPGELVTHGCDVTADVWTVESTKSSLPVQDEVIGPRARCIGRKDRRIREEGGPEMQGSEGRTVIDTSLADRHLHEFHFDHLRPCVRGAWAPDKT
jgi:hypothetical protein